MERINLEKYKHYRLAGGYHCHLRLRLHRWPWPTRRGWLWVACTPTGEQIGHGRAPSRWDAERACQQCIQRYRKVHMPSAVYYGGVLPHACGDRAVRS